MKLTDIFVGVQQIWRSIQTFFELNYTNNLYKPIFSVKQATRFINRIKLFKMPPKRKAPVLMKSRPVPIAKTKNLPKKSGTYVISEKKKRTSKVIYVGQSNNIKRRMQEHLQGQESAIDRKIRRTAKARLAVECTTGRDARYQEQREIEKIKKKTGRLPTCNKINGISK